ncbi:hypothetical protein CHUAL_013340 [Chamberlinius hualienensis]
MKSALFGCLLIAVFSVVVAQGTTSAPSAVSNSQLANNIIDTIKSVFNISQVPSIVNTILATLPGFVLTILYDIVNSDGFKSAVQNTRNTIASITAAP